VTRYRFLSDTNQTLFRYAMDESGVPYTEDGYDVVVGETTFDAKALAEHFGGWDVPDPRSTTGINGFLDISAFSTRSNPPPEIRGDPPARLRTIAETFRGQQDGSRSILETEMGNGFPARRSTRGQPL